MKVPRRRRRSNSEAPYPMRVIATNRSPRDTLGRLVRWCLIASAALLCSLTVAFALTLPALTGRIVDQVNILSAETKIGLETTLADLEGKSGIQLVVATVPSLQG